MSNIDNLIAHIEKEEPYVNRELQSKSNYNLISLKIQIEILKELKALNKKEK